MAVTGTKQRAVSDDTVAGYGFTFAGTLMFGLGCGITGIALIGSAAGIGIGLAAMGFAAVICGIVVVASSTKASGPGIMVYNAPPTVDVFNPKRTDNG